MEKKLAKLKHVLKIVLFVVLIMTWPLPQFPEAGLDGSWRIALTQLVPNDYQSVPVIFTYGMWGDLVRGALIKENAFNILVFRSIVYGAYSYLLIYYLHVSKNIWLALATFYIAILAAGMSLFMPYFQTEFELAVLPILLLCFEPVSKYLNKVITVLCIVSGFIFFTKTSLYYYIFPTTLLYASCRAFLLSPGLLWARISKVLFKILQCSFLSLGSIFIFGMIGFGRPFSHYSLLKDISSGYSSGMNSSGPAAEIVLALLLSLILFLSSLFIANSRSLISSKKAFLVRIIPSIYIIALSFKHAFVRHDHAPRFFVIQSFIFIALFSGLTFAQANKNDRRSTNIQAITITSLICSLLASVLLPTKYIIASFDFYGGQFNRHVETVGAFLGSIIGSDLFISKSIRLPQHRRLTNDEINYIGTKTIDVIPGEVSIPYFYDLNWMPRPTIQSYQGYTERLDNLNAMHLNSSGPEIILFHPDSIDNKHVSFFSPLEYQSFVCNYQRAPLPIETFRSPALDLFTRLDRSRCSLPRLVLEGKTYFDQSQRVHISLKPGLLLLKLYIKPSFIGKLAELSLRAPKLEINLSYSSNGTSKKKQIDKTYSFSYRNASNGLTLWPDSPEKVDEFLLHCKQQQTDCDLAQYNLKFLVQTNAPWFFNDELKYEIIKLEVFD